MRYDTLIFLDIDGTLLRPDYRPNADPRSVARAIRALEPHGILCCLNSNRSLHDLLPLVRSFGITGPIIGENGVWRWRRGRRHVLIRAPKIRVRLLRTLRSLAHKTSARIETADTVRYDWTRVRRVPLAWIMNRYREYTASIHVRVRGKKDVRAARSLARALRKTFGKSYTVRVSDTFANVLIIPIGAKKTAAMLALRDRAFPAARIIMIGDEIGDLPPRRAIDAFYAVGNASAVVRRRADGVARSSYTRGVVEILRSLT
ncbi:MAG: HAD hydrolase family protein [bacterium]|nr:HAD hydrolase family protein [bacterium]